MASLTRATHTPGPWMGQEDGRFGTKLVTTADDNRRYLVATVYSGSVTFDDKHHQPETDANARLIATAPDLLEAVRMAEATLTELWFDGVWGKPGKEPAILTQLREALFKAQGWES